MQANIDILQAFADHLPEGILILDKSGDVIVYNNQAIALLETSVEEILLNSLSETTFGSELFQALHDAKIGIQSQCILQSKGKYLRCGIRKASGLTGDGDQTVVSISDAGSIKRLEEVKKEFISAILHKIRSPLTTLKTSLSVLHDFESSKMGVEAREVLEMGNHEVDRLSGLLDSLRDLFKIETGLLKDDLTFESFIIIKSFANATKKNSLLHSDISSRLKIEGDVDTVVTADFHRFSRVLELIIDNALLYSQDVIDIDISLKQKYCDIQIKDYGIGISEDSMSQIFTKYFREDNSITRVIQGNGLGLFIARAWMESMSGSILCESVKDHGTTITLTIPIPGEV